MLLAGQPGGKIMDTGVRELQVPVPAHSLYHLCDLVSFIEPLRASVSLPEQRG